MAGEIVLRNEPVQVSKDLITGGKASAPAPWAERERVKQRRYIAGQAGIAVVAPGSAEIAGPVDTDEVIDARLLEPDRHADAAEPGADDDHSVRHGHSRRADQGG